MTIPLCIKFYYLIKSRISSLFLCFNFAVASSMTTQRIFGCFQRFISLPPSIFCFYQFNCNNIIPKHLSVYASMRRKVNFLAYCCLSHFFAFFVSTRLPYTSVALLQLIWQYSVRDLEAELSCHTLHLSSYCEHHLKTWCKPPHWT